MGQGEPVIFQGYLTTLNRSQVPHLFMRIYCKNLIQHCKKLIADPATPKPDLIRAYQLLINSGEIVECSDHEKSIALNLIDWGYLVGGNTDV